jgi:hypothetical protein
VAPWRILAACLVIAAAPGDVAMPSQTPGWREVGWPFPLDPWPAGRAFRCTGASCAPAVQLAVRPKLGFCNCTTGVDDDEIDRVSDLAALGDSFIPQGQGWSVDFGAFTGRARRYVVADRGGGRRFALAVAASRRCDLVVALVDSDARFDAGTERSALHLLATPRLLDWFEASMRGS